MNNDIETKLNELLKMKDDLDEFKSERKQQEVIDDFDKKQKKIKIYLYIWLAICIITMMLGWTGMQCNTIEFKINSLFFALIGLNSSILLKMWYHTMHTKISILQELKKVQIQIAEMKTPTE